MNLLFLISVIMIFSLVIIYIFEPLLNISTKKVNLFKNKDLKIEKILIMKQIQELELDFDIGNLSSEDFKLKRDILEEKVLDIEKALKD